MTALKSEIRQYGPQRLQRLSDSLIPGAVLALVAVSHIVEAMEKEEGGDIDAATLLELAGPALDKAGGEVIFARTLQYQAAISRVKNQDAELVLHGELANLCLRYKELPAAARGQTSPPEEEDDEKGKKPASQDGAADTHMYTDEELAEARAELMRQGVLALVESLQDTLTIDLREVPMALPPDEKITGITGLVLGESKKLWVSFPATFFFFSLCPIQQRMFSVCSFPKGYCSGSMLFQGRRQRASCTSCLKRRMPHPSPKRPATDTWNQRGSRISRFRTFP